MGMQLRTKVLAAAATVLAGAGVAGPAAAAATASPAMPAAAADTAAAAAPAGDHPKGFWYGTDSSTISMPGPKPYQEPAIGGNYGGYIGMIGNFAQWQGCGAKTIWSVHDGAAAHTNFTKFHDGVGVGGYWFMGGPGVDPHYNGTTAEATSWGAAQAKKAIKDLPALPSQVNYPVVFMDIELPGHAPDFTPAPDNGWNSVYTSACSGVVKQSGVPAAMDRADLNGFASYLTSHSSYKAGVYSAPSIWGSIFGTGASAKIPNTYEWTYNGLTTSLAHPPNGWTLPGTSTSAQFFGGQTSSSKFALMWQWSGGGGARNGVGDFDQIDGSRTPA